MSIRPTIVFDVLGTLVDQAGSLEHQVAAAAGVPAGTAASIVDRWLSYVSEQERAIIDGRRPFEASHRLDAEALGRLAAENVLPGASVAELTGAAEHLRPWPDTVDGLELLAGDLTVLGLSNASRRVLAGLSGNALLRWHRVLSAEDVATYKPAAAVYELAMNSTPPEASPPFMVAAHAWDLRAAAAAGMRTAYVPRPNGDSPRPDDGFDLYATDLRDLHSQLLALSPADGAADEHPRDP